jgi:Kef-type K+ transport system membrane component KefB/voltage-gated potassium channel Kch
MDTVFSELSLVLIIATAVSLVMKFLKQPLILGYILSGLLVGPALLGLIHSPETFETFSHIGITLLLFIIGLGLNIAVIKRLGKVVFVAALAEMVIVGGLGFLASKAMSFTTTEALIIGLALFFSSTIIIVKVLTDKKEQNRLHGQIAVGIILVDDIVATFALLFVAAGKESVPGVGEIAVLLGKGALLIGLLWLCSSKIIPKASKFIAGSQELLFLAAIAWGFGIARLFEVSGFSIEVGALFAGVALGGLPYAQEIGSRLKPLRDFFVVVFFIVLGESLNVDNLAAGLMPALVLSIIVIALKPATIITVLGKFGYTKRVSFKAGINLSQISEFSIVLVVLAASVGMIRPEISAIITLVAIITIASSTYLMHYDDRLFAKFDHLRLRSFDKSAVHRDQRVSDAYPYILFGYEKGGHEFVHVFKQMKERYVVVDYDPAVTEVMEHRQLPYVYGDATDVELLTEVGVPSAKLIISTITDFHTSQQIAKHVNHLNPKAILISSADNQEEARKLYDLGSTYVMIPHYIGSEKISTFVRNSGLRKSAFKEFRDQHLKYLEKQFGVLEKTDAENERRLGRTIIRSMVALTKSGKI